MLYPDVFTSEAFRMPTFVQRYVLESDYPSPLLMKPLILLVIFLRIMKEKLNFTRRSDSLSLLVSYPLSTFTRSGLTPQPSGPYSNK